MSYLGIPPFGQTVRTVTEKVAVQDQVDFYPDGGYLPGYIDVEINGQSLLSTDYFATDGIKITLVVAANSLDEFRSVAYWPVAFVDTFRKSEADARFLNLAGGTLTGTLNVGGNVLLTPNSGNARVMGLSNGTNTTLVLQGGGNGAGALGANIELGANGYGLFDAVVSRFRSLDGSTNYAEFTAAGAKVYGTGSLQIPIGTTAERPGTPTAGMIRMNSTNGEAEFYNGVDWKAFSQQYPGIYGIDYLLVAGGGGSAGGAAEPSGGGGAGGLLTGTISSVSGVSTVIVLGGGGAGTTSTNSAASGANTSATGVLLTATAVGGGRAGTGNGGTGAGGGSGGGGSGWAGGSGGSGTAGQGNAGGYGGNGLSGYASGGGGGKGSNGVAAAGGKGGDGGQGYAWLNGVYYAGGGGGGVLGSGSTGLGGGGSATKGGGGDGCATPTNSSGNSGTSNTGGGGGAGNGSGSGGNGGSGVAIFRYLGAPKATGGTITQAGGYTYHTFTSSGTFTA